MCIITGVSDASLADTNLFARRTEPCERSCRSVEDLVDPERARGLVGEGWLSWKLRLVGELESQRPIPSYL